MPKYIGFLEYLNMPNTTNDEAFSISKGFTVVFCFLKALTAEIRTAIPIIKNKPLTISNKPLLNSGNKDLEKYINNPKVKVTIGGGILLFIIAKR